MRAKMSIVPAAIAGIVALAGADRAEAEMRTAYLAGGCFWCVEADFEKVEGVGDVVSGLTGGTTADPTYEASGDHIEAVRVPFDDDVVSLRQIYDLFLRSIDPLDAGGQFCDRGLEYTTAIFVTDEQQRETARAAIADAERELGREIVTEMRMPGEFYPVDAYHQDYYKSEDRIAFSMVGVAVPKSVAYERYRENCGRDQRVEQVWGADAPFID